MSLQKIATVSILTGLLAFVQGSQAQDKSAPARRPAAAAASPVDSVIKLIKSGLSETLIIKTLQKQKPYTPSPDEMVKLKEAGASDNIIGVMIDPSSAPAAAPPPAAPAVAAAPRPSAATAAPVVASAGGADCPAPAAVSAAANASKRRVAISAFDYAAVRTAVTAIAGGNDVNIGQGIRSMLMVKMAQSNTVVLVEREKIQQVMKEQDFGATNRVKQGTQAKIGQITGADAQLFGDIVTFGRDDTTKKNGAGAAGFIPGVFGRAAAGAANARQTDKAVVVINLRLVDSETGEVIDAEEARGESTRTSTNWAAIGGSWRGGAGASSDMTSSNFGATIIGEATQDAVNKIAAILETKMIGISAKSRTIEGKVANIDGCTLYISVGGNDGVHVGDHFEIHQILKEVLDPDTKEVLDKQTVKVGDFIVSTVRDKVSIGDYGGKAITPAWQKGYAARLVKQ